MHDQDVDDKGQPVREHVHVMMTFDNARFPTAVAKGLGDKPQTVEVWNGDSRNGYAYLCHRTANARSKFQYDPVAVIANFDYAAELERYEAGAAAARVTAKVPILLDALYDGDLTPEDLKRQLAGSQIGRYDRQISAVLAARLGREAAEWRAKMKTEGRRSEAIWLYGETGTGKTSMARDLASRRADSRGYFMRGSSRGVFENYQGQHVLLLDEIGPGAIPYEDLKRITDPAAIEDEIHAPSRYRDKQLMPELIIFTSPFSPLELYLDQVGGGIDAFAQFARRLTLVLRMTQSEIQVMTFDARRRAYIPVLGAIRQNVYSSSTRADLATAAPVPDPAAQFGVMCDALGLVA